MPAPAFWRNALRDRAFWHRATPLLVGLGLGLLALGPGLQRGFLLSYDMIFVPREPLSAALPGLAPPRVVPSDLMVVLASRVLPADIVQKLVLVAIFALACSGVAALLDAEPMLARLAGGVCYAWNPYVAERLIIGQWALLLGYAGLPWVLRALVADGRRQGLRLCLAVVPAIIGGVTAMAITALLAIPVVLVARNARKAALTVAVLAVGCLPWLIPSLLHPVYADPAGVAAFAARPDTPFGTIGSLIMLGGIWNAQTVPTAYGGWWSAIWLSITLGAAIAFVVRGKRGRWPGVGFAAVTGLVLASVGVTAAGRGVLRDAIAAWPGFAVLRDAQQFVAPLALAEAIGFGLLVAWAQGADRPAAAQASRVDPAGRIVATIGLLAPVLLLPGLAWGAAGRLHPVGYPPGWLAAARAIDTAPVSGDVLLLPWATDRSPSWNGGEVMLDPWPRLLSRPLIWNDGTRVGNQWLAPDDPRARRLDAVLRPTTIPGDATVPIPLTGTLRAAGVRFVVVDAGPSLSAWLPGAVRTIDQPGLTVYELPGPNG